MAGLMKMLMILGAMFVLVTGFSIGCLLFYFRPSMPKGRLQPVFLVAAGLAVSLVTIALAIIAVWPPFDPVTFILPFLFLLVLVGIFYFIKTTRPKQITQVSWEREAKLPQAM